MGYREFVDSEENLWRVWATLPTALGVIAKEFENGWLTFESGSGCKRLAPIPDRWEDMSEAKLRALLKQAAPARKKSPG